MTRPLGALVATVAVAISLAACGGGELPAKRGLPASTVLVTQKDVLEHRPHTPERTVMAWWRAMQYTDARGYLSLLAAPVRTARRRDLAYRIQLPIIARQVEAAFPHIQDTEITGDTATVFVEIEFRRLVGADKFASTRLPQAFTLVRESQTWRIADDLFVEAGVVDVLRAREIEDTKAGLDPQQQAPVNPTAPLPDEAEEAEPTATPASQRTPTPRRTPSAATGAG